MKLSDDLAMIEGLEERNDFTTIQFFTTLDHHLTTLHTHKSHQEMIILLNIN